MVAAFVASQRLSVNHFPANEYAVQNKCRMCEFRRMSLVPMNGVALQQVSLPGRISLLTAGQDYLGSVPILCGIYAPIVQHLRISADDRALKLAIRQLSASYGWDIPEKVFGFDYGGQYLTRL